jgi:homoserine kinase
LGQCYNIAVALVQSTLLESRFFKEKVKRTIRVTVPATSANLGPGFDSLGMALSLFNVVEVRRAESFALDFVGEGQGSLSRGRDNLVSLAVDTILERVGCAGTNYHLKATSEIPLARGLGSSAAAVVAGLLAGNALCDHRLPLSELIDMASTLEGHPDNVAAAMLGGCLVAVEEAGRIVYAKVPVPDDLLAVLFIPELVMATQASRAMLPSQVPRADAVFNIGRAALLVASLFSGQLGHLRVATQDRLHQHAREAVFPAMPKLFQAALDAGALGVFLSGAGSTVLALAREQAGDVALAMTEMARALELPGRAMVVPPSRQGALVEEIDGES